MKKGWAKGSRAIALLLAAVTAVSLTGCGTGTGDSSNTSEGQSGGVTSGVSQGDPAVSGSEPVSEGFADRTVSDPNITVFIPYAIPEVMEEVTIPAYEAKYGGKVTVVDSEWAIRHTKLSQLIQSGDAPDVVSVYSGDMPNMALKGLLEPLDGLTDFENDLYSQEVNDTSFMFGSSHYAVSNSISPNMILYNKTMFKNAALDDPYELYQEGKWDWNTFRQAALDLTQDTDFDGNADIWGFGTWQDAIFPMSNGVNILEMEDGSPVLKIDDPQVIAGLQLYYEMFNNDISIQVDHFQWFEGFRDKKVGMIFIEGHVQAERLIEEGQFSDEMGLVPFPKGPDAEKYVTYGTATGWGMGLGSGNSEASMAFIEMYITDLASDNAALGSEENAPLSKECYDLVLEMRNSDDFEVMIPLFFGYGSMDPIFTQLTDELRQNKPVGTTVASYKPLLQAEIDKVLADS